MRIVDEESPRYSFLKSQSISRRFHDKNRKKMSNIEIADSVNSDNSDAFWIYKKKKRKEVAFLTNGIDSEKINVQNYFFFIRVRIIY